MGGALAWQTGGLLSDVFLHLVPHSFLGEHQDDSIHFVMVEEKRNILVGYVSTQSPPFHFAETCSTVDGMTDCRACCD